MKNPNIREITSTWLLANGYDGLWRDGDDACGCCLDDLMPCCEMPCYESNMMDCHAGYMVQWIEDGWPTWGLAESKEEGDDA